MTAVCEAPGCKWTSAALFSRSESQGHVQDNPTHEVWDD